MQTFQDLISGEKPVLVDFSAEWCGPCKMLAPELKKLSDMMGEEVKIIKVDVDKNPDAAAHYGIRGVPTLMLFQEGKTLWRQSGVMSADQMKNIIQQHVK
jgi:thioredoxin 1